MAYPKNFRKGGKAEYITQVYLTSLGFSNPTYRQEDFGIDFTCVLTEEINKQLYPILPFNLQVKSHKEKEKQVLKFKKKTPQDLDWLFKNPNPYFLAWLDFENTKDIYFYSLSPLWYIDISKSEYKDLVFIYDTDLTELENVNNYKQDTIIVDTHFIKLGKPFMTMKLEDIKDDKKIAEKSAILKRMIQLEKENIQYRIFGMPFMRWLWKFKTNELDSFIFGWSHFCNSEVYKQINEPKELVKNIGHLLITLASSFALNNDDKENEEYENYHLSLVNLIKLLPLNENNYGDILKNLNYIDANGNFIQEQVKFPHDSLGPTGNTPNPTKIEITPPLPKEEKPNPIYTPKRKNKKKQ